MYHQFLIILQLAMIGHTSTIPASIHGVTHVTLISRWVNTTVFTCSNCRNTDCMGISASYRNYLSKRENAVWLLQGVLLKTFQIKSCI